MRLTAILLAALLCVPPCPAALNFTAGSHNVNHGSATNLDDLQTWTAIFWMNPGTLGDFNSFLVKDPGGGAGNRYVYWEGTDEITVDVRVPTHNNLYKTNNANITTGKWWYIAITFDNGAAAGEHVNVYLGDTTTSPTERTYGTTTHSSQSSASDAAGSLTIGNYALGHIAFFAHWNKVLTSTEIVRQWKIPFALDPTGIVVFSHYSPHGAGTAPDWSGTGNTGTVTGAAHSAHVPIGWFTPGVLGHSLTGWLQRIDRALRPWEYA